MKYVFTAHPSCHGDPPGAQTVTLRRRASRAPAGPGARLGRAPRAWARRHAVGVGVTGFFVQFAERGGFRLCGEQLSGHVGLKRRSKSAWVMVSSAPKCSTPALLTSRSRPPHDRGADSAAASGDQDPLARQARCRCHDATYVLSLSSLDVNSPWVGHISHISLLL